jgi:putative heme-binding domain-containing protein
MDRKQVDQALGRLLSSTEGALAITLQMHRGALRDDDFRAAISAGNAARGDIRGLFETFVPESKRRATLGALVDPQVILSRQGDRERGKLIFFSDGARCRACHEIDDAQKSLGPTLQEVAKKHPQTADLLEHVLQPSKRIDEPFAAYTVLTDDGRTLLGLILARNDREIVLKTVDRQTVRIATENVAEVLKSDKSLMPERVLSDLTAQEAADLLEYIRSQSAAK